MIGANRVRFVIDALRFRPASPSLSIAVSPRGAYSEIARLWRPGWLSAWEALIDGHWDVVPWTIGLDIALQHGRH